MKKIYIVLVILIVSGILYVALKGGSKSVAEWVKEADVMCRNSQFSRDTCYGVDFVRANKSLTDQEYCDAVDLTPQDKRSLTKEGNILICKNEIARNKESVSSCLGKDSSVAWQRNNYQSCVYSIVVNSGNAGSCGPELFPSIELQDECYAGIAQFSKDQTVCEKSSSKLSESKCYYNYFAETGPSEATDCEKMIDPIRSDCYAQVARKKKDNSLCQKIDAGYIVSGSSYGFDGMRKLRDICIDISDPKFGVQ